MTHLVAVNIPFVPDHWKKVQAVAADSGLSASSYVRLAVSVALKADARKARADA